jgi:signal transduction histidine kinase
MLSLTEPDSTAVFDPKWTAEAVYNLLDNAVKYTPAGGKISVRAAAYELFCRIDVTDTGIGIAEAEQAKIFTRFYRSPAVAETEGVGIGLFLTRQIVTGQGGYVKVSSAPGKGATFSVFLPRKA